MEEMNNEMVIDVEAEEVESSSNGLRKKVVLLVGSFLVGAVGTLVYSKLKKTKSADEDVEVELDGEYEISGVVTS